MSKATRFNPAVVILACLLFLVSANSWSVSVVSRCWEPDGPYVLTANLGTRCPAKLTSASATLITDNDYLLSHSTTLATTTTYYYTVANPTDAVCSTLQPNRKRHIAGTGAYAFSTTTLAGSGPQTETIGTGVGADTALVAESPYCTFVLQMYGQRPSNRLIVSVETIPTAAPGGDPMTLSGFFVDTTGGGCTYNGTSCDGASHSERLSSLAQVPSSAAEGTDIWIRSSSVHDAEVNGNYATEWGGSEGSVAARAYIGCYYLDTGRSSVPTACWEGTLGDYLDARAADPDAVTTMGTGLTLPMIRGSISDACIAAVNCDWTWAAGSADDGCSSASEGLLTIDHDSVWVVGLNISGSSCNGVSQSKTNASGEIISNVMFRSNIVENAGFRFYEMRNVQYTVVKGNIFRVAGVCEFQSLPGQGNAPTPSSIGNCGKAGHSGGVVTTGTDNAWAGYVDNTVIRTFSEGLQCYGSTKVWVKGNRVGNTQFGNFYGDACEGSIVESNIIWKTAGDAGQPSGHSLGADRGRITFSVEASGGATATLTNLWVRNNLMASPATCLQGGFTKLAAGLTEQRTYGIGWFHNTCLGGRDKTIDIGTNLDLVSATDGDVYNNIFAAPSASTSSVCFSDVNMTYNYNLYGSGDNAVSNITASCKGVNDMGGSASSVNPALVLNPITTSVQAQWAATDHNNQPDPDNARITADGNFGLRLNNVPCVSAADATEFAKIAHEMDYPYGLDTGDAGTDVDLSEMANWRQCAYYDFFGNARGDSPNVGMHEHGGAL